MEFNVAKLGEFEYLDEGEGEVMLCLHGLFGALSNWGGFVKYFSKTHRVIVPFLPIYVKTEIEATLNGLSGFVNDFVQTIDLKDDFYLVGNSLGGHLAMVYYLSYQAPVKSLVLTGSSGLFEKGMGSSFPKRSNKEFIRDRIAYTFYSPESATDELIDEVFDIVNNTRKAIRIIRVARAAQRHNMSDDLEKIEVPTLLIWGLNDNITPTYVAHEFNKLLPNATLKFIDKCGHAPMMERPEEFNTILEHFLEKL